MRRCHFLFLAEDRCVTLPSSFFFKLIFLKLNQVFEGLKKTKQNTVRLNRETVGRYVPYRVGRRVFVSGLPSAKSMGLLFVGSLSFANGNYSALFTKRDSCRRCPAAGQPTRARETQRAECGRSVGHSKLCTERFCFLSFQNKSVVMTTDSETSQSGNSSLFFYFFSNFYLSNLSFGNELKLIVIQE